jgi:proteasome lid subunit RPN8/RPN11
MIVLTDTVERDIVSFIGEHPAERGGALLGPRTSNLVSHFIYDEAAATTSVSYTPSRSLNEAVRTAEKEMGLVLKGIVHSHPGTYDELSGGDLSTIARHLEANPHLPSFFAPIVNRRSGPFPPGSHVLDLGDGLSLTCYEAWRTRKRKPGFDRGAPGWRPLEIHRVSATVMPADAAALAVVDGLRKVWGSEEVETGHIRMSGLHYEVRIYRSGGASFSFSFRRVSRRRSPWPF